MTLVELTGLKARDLPEMVENVRKAPPAVIYHHTHHFLRQHQFLSPEPRNDFAFWVTNVLQEDRLGEQLAAIDTVRFTSIKELGDKLLQTMEKYLNATMSVRSAPPGEEFYFMKSQSFILPTPYIVSDLADFNEAIKKVSIHSLYHHMFSSRLRLGKESNDFSMWFKSELGEEGLAKAVAKLDPYTQTLEGLRQRIISLVVREINAVSR
jgi:hypothetical protein